MFVSTTQALELARIGVVDPKDLITDDRFEIVDPTRRPKMLAHDVLPRIELQDDIAQWTFGYSVR
jgi:hypothetical protein